MIPWKYKTFGIPDEMFIRTEGVPMTKHEIRVLSLVKLQLFPNAIVYDIGAGSGSVAIESKLIANEGEVYAVEKNTQAIKTIEQNCRQFDIQLQMIEGEAPNALQELPSADRIFIGGSGGNLKEIINVCDRKLKSGGRIVLNSVTLTTGSDAYKYLEELGYEVEAIQINVSYIAKRGNVELWQARNPVTIIAAGKREE